MDKLIIKEIEFIGHCGITSEERAAGQRLSADIEVAIDLSNATVSDRVEDTIDYTEICATVVAIGRRKTYHLLETLADRIVKGILKGYPVSEVTIRLRKCSVPVEAVKGYFEVVITRRRD